MAFKNSNTSPARQGGTPAKGVRKAGANLPANNVGTFPVSLGSTHSSKFGVGVGAKAAQGGLTQSKGSKANMPANNKTDKAVKLGTTKHGVGAVPGYLKGC